MTTGILLLTIGFAVGTFGTLIGAGGGFILMPILLLLYPGEPAHNLTSLSLAVVFCNALSGSIAYAFKRRIDFRSALIFSVASIPGALLGVHATQQFPREVFELMFGGLMVLMGLYLLRPRLGGKHVEGKAKENGLATYNMPLGIAVSLGVGFVSSFLGIGGGIIHVPALVHLLHFPVHMATATSHAILSVMSAVATGENFWSGHLDGSWDRIVYLGPGVVVGAQLGAFLSSRIKGVWIIRSLALALISVGLRFVFFR